MGLRPLGTIIYLLATTLSYCSQVDVTDRPVVKRHQVLGFATSTNQIPFTFDRVSGSEIKNVVPISGSSLPQVGDNRAALEAEGEKVAYSIGAVVDPSTYSLYSYIWFKYYKC